MPLIGTLRNAELPVSASTILYTPFESLAASAAAAQEAGMDVHNGGASRPMQTDGVAAAASANASSDSPERAAAQSTILHCLLKDLIHNSKPEVSICNM